jgi:ceramide glucosyltransferase
MQFYSVIALPGAFMLGISSLYALLTLVAAVVWQTRRTPPISSNTQPAVTILIPLCGPDPQLYENLRSFCLQNYSIFQLVLGARDRSDPALVIAERVAREFPGVAIQIVADERLHGSNRKISNLINMLPFARHELLVIIDSDTRVGLDHLSVVIQTLLQPGIGLVTCLYRSVPVGGIWSILGSMYVNDWYTPSVMLAWLFGHRKYVSGQTMALRRETLVALGGLEAIADRLADDYALGMRVRQLGLRIALASETLDTAHSEGSAAALTAHELRWMRTLRALAPGGFPFLFLSFSTPLLVTGAWFALLERELHLLTAVLLGITLAARTAVSCLVRRHRRPRIALIELILLPIRDILLCWTWLRALMTSRVCWRGYDFEVDRRGVLRSSL